MSEVKFLISLGRKNCGSYHIKLLEPICANRWIFGSMSGNWSTYSKPLCRGKAELMASCDS